MKAALLLWDLCSVSITTTAVTVHFIIKCHNHITESKWIKLDPFFTLFQGEGNPHGHSVIPYICKATHEQNSLDERPR